MFLEFFNDCRLMIPGSAVVKNNGLIAQNVLIVKGVIKLGNGDASQCHRAGKESNFAI